ncbi:putrescine-ornithine antiporter [Dialister micraerophilus]|uniref:Putrescine transporter n=1 Tax=Dialister micraerophilus UPII 345-E TaxID=910314 RepID=E4L769_9FIRM|nr:putrescine-ornithine antiporter [Dialister micraerophilus]EFR43355.1 amino acid permease [Dialister micraerophilus UPII 345-E]
MGKNKLNLFQLTIMTAVSMMGSGIVMLPAKLGQIGAISIFSWIVTAIGSVCLAIVFGKCGMYSQKEGGMVGYAEYAFGHSGNFLVSYSYGISCVIANTAMALSGAGYLAELVGVSLTPFETAIWTAVILWASTILNWRGPGFTGKVSSFTVWGVIIACGLLCTLGWFWFSPSLYLYNWNVSGLPFAGAVTESITMTLWAFLGLETACANAERVENPHKNIPRAILFGITLAALCYIVTTNIMFGIVPASELANSSAPFGFVFKQMFNGYVGNIIILLILINDFGALVSWQFTAANVFLAAANAGHFPKIFKKLNSFSAPVLGMIILTLIQTALAFMTVSPTLIKQYEILVDLSVITTIVAYLLSMASVRVLMRTAGCDEHEIKYISMLAMIGSVYSLYACYASGLQAMAYGGLAIFLGWVLYGRVADNGKREI